ncbi:MAG: hypothetical protein QW680_13080 [Pyrobaculum sp.]
MYAPEIAVAARREEFASVRERILTRYLQKCAEGEVRAEVLNKAVKPAVPNCASAVGENICLNMIDCVYREAGEELATWLESGIVDRERYMQYREALRNIYKCAKAHADVCAQDIYYEVAITLGAGELSKILSILRTWQERQ